MKALWYIIGSLALAAGIYLIVIPIVAVATHTDISIPTQLIPAVIGHIAAMCLGMFFIWYGNKTKKAIA